MQLCLAVAAGIALRGAPGVRTRAPADQTSAGTIHRLHPLYIARRGLWRKEIPPAQQSTISFTRKGEGPMKHRIPESAIDITDLNPVRTGHGSRVQLGLISRTILIAAFFAVITPIPVESADCTSADDWGKFKNVFSCPVDGGAAIRQGDSCAKEGGTFRAARGIDRYHNALDLDAMEGTKVLATKPGKVAVAANDWGSMGSTVIIDHEDGDYSVYGHLNDVSVSSGKCVKSGEAIGTVGYSGNAKCLKDNNLSAHLHFAVIRAARLGLADGSGPISAAIKNGQDWIEFARDFFPGDNLDLGIKDPSILLQNTVGCLK